ncbi:pantoate--beta-alanine ligase, partial [Vibrio campbellii]
AGLQPDEIFIRDARTLQAITAETTQAVILMSAFLGKARLIDNQTVDMVVETKEEESSEANSASAE